MVFNLFLRLIPESFTFQNPVVHFDASNGGNASFVNPVYDVVQPGGKEKMAEQEYAEIPEKRLSSGIWNS